MAGPAAAAAVRLGAAARRPLAALAGAVRARR